MLLDINHFIEKEKRLPKHYVSKEFFNYQLNISRPPKLKDLENGQEIIEAMKFYRKNLGITHEAFLKALVTMCCLKHKPTKKDLEHQIRKMKKKKPKKLKLRELVLL